MVKIDFLLPRNADIQYYYLTPKRDNISFFLPLEFDNGVLHGIMRLPRSLHQIYNSEDFYKLEMMFESPFGHQFFTIYFETIFSEGIKKYVIGNAIKIFILSHYNHKILNEIFKYFPEAYLTSPSKDVKKNITDKFPVEKHKVFDDYKTLFSFLKRDIKLITDEELKKCVVENLKSQKNDNSKKDFEFPNFRPAHPNAFTLNQITAYLWDNEYFEKIIPRNEKRFKYLVKQAKLLDTLFLSLYGEGKVKRLHKFSSVFPPIILSFPVINETIIKNLEYLNKKHNQTANIDFKAFLKIVKLEQDSNYTFPFPNINGVNKETVSHFQTYGQFANSHLEFLDGVSYLHSSSTYSPVIRFPLKCKIFNQWISKFSPEQGDPPTLKKCFNEIRNFGKFLNKTYLTKEAEKWLRNRNGPIVAISDLPIEWMIVNDVPLSFTHDVCRLPSTNTGGLMSHYARNNSFNFEIPRDILSKTLLVLGSPNDSKFSRGYSYAEKILANELSIKVLRPYSIKDVINGINKFRPLFLIFDTHGDYDPETRTSYLLINGEKLTGEIVERNNISAPLIFLSACYGNPLWGYVNTICEAFLGAGAFCVTASYLPINLIEGTMLYNRILYNLITASQEPIHKDWLSFIGHNIRTSIYTNVLVHSGMKPAHNESHSNSNDFEKSVNEWAQNALEFNNRNKVYNKWLRKGKSGSFPKYLPHEYLYYTTIGRADLIKFKCYNDGISECRKKEFGIENMREKVKK